MSEPTLAELQRSFAAALLAGGDPAPTLFRGPAERNARRFGLVRGNLLANWHNALGNAFPVLRALVGEAFFRGLARRYGRAHDFGEGDLNRFGSAFAAFLDEFAPAREIPYLGAVARLEWALHCAHYAADAPALEGAALGELGAGRLDALRLRPRPGVRLLQSEWAIGRIWRAHQPHGAAALPADPREQSRVLVFRPRWRVELCEIEPAEFAALAALFAGEPLGAALEAACAADHGFDPARALPRWLEQALFLPPET